LDDFITLVAFTILILRIQKSSLFGWLIRAPVKRSDSSL